MLCALYTNMLGSEPNTIVQYFGVVGITAVGLVAADGVLYMSRASSCLAEERVPE